jgi:hypothetical protein
MLPAMDDNGNLIVGGGSALYKSYLLRLWRDEPAGARWRWRAMLESVTEPGERHHFADVHRMLAFLHATCTHCKNEPPDTS